ADPGPACYGRGGSEATVTDANLALGYYDPAFFLGGRMTLDRDAALAALGRLGGQIGLSALEAAHGIHEIVTESMAAAARIHLVEKGRDPRNYAIVGFGGAGPAHAAGVARILGIREVIIPPASGVASCLGFLTAPLSFERVRSQPLPMSDASDVGAIAGILRELEHVARARARAGAADNARAERARGRAQAQGLARSLVRPRLRRSAGLRPIRARGGRSHRGTGDHRGARSDHRGAAGRSRGSRCPF